MFRFDDPGDRSQGARVAGLAAERRGSSRAVAVAIPVKNESDRLANCFMALAAQKDHRGRALDPESIRVVVFANNCTDDSAPLARSLAERLRLNVCVVEAWLPAAEAHAGNGRRAAMDIAESWLAQTDPRTGVILTTDADSQAPPLWIADNLAAFDSGADAVLGQVELDEEGAALPQALKLRGQRESDYQALLTELSARLDPVHFNPWPHHATISGASLAVTRDAYLRAGGAPRPAWGRQGVCYGAVPLRRPHSLQSGHCRGDLGPIEGPCPRRGGRYASPALCRTGGALRRGARTARHCDRSRDVAKSRAATASRGPSGSQSGMG